MNDLNQYGVPKFLLWIVAVVILIGVIATGYILHKDGIIKESAETVVNSTETTKLIGILLQSQDKGVSSVARDALAKMADSSTVQAIAKAYHEEAKLGWQQSSLMGALLRVSSPNAVAGLSNIINNDPDFSLKDQAAIALGSIGTADAIQAIVTAIDKSSSVAFTRVLIETLAAVKNKNSLNSLAALLNANANENIRRAAASAIGNIPGDASITTLKNAQQKESSQIVKYAIELSLNKLSGNTGVNYVPLPVDSSVILKEYKNSVYAIKYPPALTLEEKQAKTDNGIANYVLLKPIEKNGVSQVMLTVSPTSIDDLDFYEGIVTGPHYAANKKVTYGILNGYLTIQPATNSQEGMMVQVFDKEHSYLIKYEIIYAGVNQKVKDSAVEITQDILNNFRYIK